MDSRKRWFDRYAFADYSGSRSKQEQRKHIVLAVMDSGGTDSIELTGGVTRSELRQSVLRLLRLAEREGKRLLFGFDHNYGFPEGFHEAVHGAEPSDWHAVLDGFAGTVRPGLMPGESLPDEVLDSWNPREWARTINERIGLTLETGAGPFWGTLFERRPDPSMFGRFRLPDGTAYELKERRLAEERLRRLKPAYQLGGIGSVGQQSLFGMLHLRELLLTCRKEGIPVFVWPQDGVEVPSRGHVLAEMYPTLCLGELGLKGVPRSDAGDAQACVVWAERNDSAGDPEGFFRLDGLTAEELRRARLEGWPLGL